MMSEWLRIKKAVIITVFLHLFVLAFLIQFGLFVSYEIGFKMVIVLLYGSCGYLFGITQLRKYTQNSHWTYFINRPINVKKVYLALLITTVFAIIIAIVLPYFMVTIVLDFWKIEIIDWRHYQQLAYLFGMTLSFYLLACFTVLIKRKSVHLLIMVIILPLISLNVGGSVYWLLFGVVVFLFLMVISAVKVNLNEMPKGLLFQLTTATAYQYALYIIIFSLFFVTNQIVSEIKYRTKDTTIDAIDNEIKGEVLESESFKELTFMKNKDALISSLWTKDRRYSDLIEEVKLSDTTRIRKRVWFHPVKQQMPFIDENETAIADVENNIKWQFSHDLMLFIGNDVVNKTTIGYLGPNHLFTELENVTKEDKFQTVPWVEYDQIVVKNKVYQYQSNLKSFRLLFRGNEEEYLLNGLQHNGSVKAIVTTKNLYLFDSINYDNEELPLQAQVIMPLPDDYNNLWDIQISEVIDRFVLTLLYGKSSRHDVYDAQHISYELTLAGQIKLLNQKGLKQNPPYLINDLEYMVSPVWKLVLDYFPTHPTRDRYLDQRPQSRNLSGTTKIILVILALLYLMITLIQTDRRGVKGLKKWSWAILNTVLGLPGVMSFLLLNPKKFKLINQERNLGDNHV